MRELQGKGQDCVVIVDLCPTGENKKYIQLTKRKRQWAEWLFLLLLQPNWRTFAQKLSGLLNIPPSSYLFLLSILYPSIYIYILANSKWHRRRKCRHGVWNRRTCLIKRDCATLRRYSSVPTTVECVCTETWRTGVETRGEYVGESRGCNVHLRAS